MGVCTAALVTGDTEEPAAPQPKPDPIHRQLQPERWSEGGRAAGLHPKPGEAQ